MHPLELCRNLGDGCKKRCLGRCLQRVNIKRYDELVRKLGEERAVEILDSERRCRVVYTELREDEGRETLEQRNAEFEDEGERCLGA